MLLPKLQKNAKGEKEKKKQNMPAETHQSWCRAEVVLDD